MFETFLCGSECRDNDPLSELESGDEDVAAEFCEVVFRGCGDALQQPKNAEAPQGAADFLRRPSGQMGLEEPVAYAGDAIFGWYVKGAPQMHIGIDPNKGHNGERSLRLVFQVRTNVQDLNASQLIAVTPNKEYDFECYVATDKLETGAAPQIQILDANNGEALGTSAMASTGTNDWQRIGFSFKTSEKTQAIMLKVVRYSCSNEDTPICPIFGSVWYDDFTLKRRN